MPPGAGAAMGLAAYRNSLEAVTRVNGGFPEVVKGDPVTAVKLPETSLNAEIELGLPALPAIRTIIPPHDTYEHKESKNTPTKRLTKRGTAFFIFAPMSRIR